MDSLEDYRLVECLGAGTLTDMAACYGAVWSAPVELIERSVASTPVAGLPRRRLERYADGRHQGGGEPNSGHSQFTSSVSGIATKGTSITSVKCKSISLLTSMKSRCTIPHLRRVPKKGGGGQSGRLYLPGIDRYFKVADARRIMEARGGRRLLACPDRDCCPRGLEDMVGDPKAHFLTQRRRQLIDLERVPDLRRRSRFLDHHLASADRTARQVAKLRVPDEAIKKALARVTQRLDAMRGVLEDLDRTFGDEATRSLPVIMRAAVQARKEQGRS
jgi:hypothetical protein